MFENENCFSHDDIAVSRFHLTIIGKQSILNFLSDGPDRILTNILFYTIIWLKEVVFIKWPWTRALSGLSSNFTRAIWWHGTSDEICFSFYLVICLIFNVIVTIFFQIPVCLGSNQYVFFFICMSYICVKPIYWTSKADGRFALGLYNICLQTPGKKWGQCAFWSRFTNFNPKVDKISSII